MNLNNNQLGNFKQAFSDLMGPQNPYWEKWKRGRPSADAKAKREKYWLWQKENRPSVGFLKHLLTKKSHITTNSQGKTVKIKYIKRGTNQ